MQIIQLSDKAMFLFAIHIGERKFEPDIDLFANAAQLLFFIVRRLFTLTGLIYRLRLSGWRKLPVLGAFDRKLVLDEHLALMIDLYAIRILKRLDLESFHPRRPIIIAVKRYIAVLVNHPVMFKVRPRDES